MTASVLPSDPPCYFQQLIAHMFSCSLSNSFFSTHKHFPSTLLPHHVPIPALQDGLANRLNSICPILNLPCLPLPNPLAVKLLWFDAIPIFQAPRLETYLSFQGLHTCFSKLPRTLSPKITIKLVPSDHCSLI